MSDKELIATKTDLQKALGEHQAEAKLQQAEKLLQEILKTYPKSPAAKQARKMLETQKGAEGEEASAIQPEPFGFDAPANNK